MTTSGLVVAGVLVAGLLAGGTVVGTVAARQGWGADPGGEHVSLRQGSVSRGGFFHTFHSRSHFGGGLGLGK